MLKKYLFIGLVIASLIQESFAADFGADTDVRTPPPHNVLAGFEATGSDPEHRENELVRVESLRLVSGRGRRPRAGIEGAQEAEEAPQPQTPDLRAVNLLERLQPVAEISFISPPNLVVVIDQIQPRLEVPITAQQETSQPLAQQETLGFFDDIQDRATQSPPLLQNVLQAGEEVAQDVPNTHVTIEAPSEVSRVQLRAYRRHLSANALVPTDQVSLHDNDQHSPNQSLTHCDRESTDHCAHSANKENKTARSTNDDTSQTINQTTLSTKEAEVKHAKIQTAQPVGLHGLTAHLVNTTSFRMATPMAGLAAGSEDLITYGFWSSAFGTFGKQRDTLDEKRFKFIQKGVVVGADGLLNENILLGIAYSNSAILRTYDTEDLMSNKQKIMSHIFSLYGSYKFENPFYVSAQAQYGKIHLKERRKSNIDSSIFVSGETKGQMYGGKIEAGYNFNNIDGLYFIPKLGISYNSSQLRAFNESGTGVAFTFHDSMKSSRLATSAGLEIRKKFAAKHHILVPSMYFAVEKILIQKNGNVRISNEELSLNQINLVTKSPRDKEAFMIGGKISAYHKKGYEVDLGYDLLLQSKYQSHTGSLKFKVNF